MASPSLVQKEALGSLLLQLRRLACLSTEALDGPEATELFRSYDELLQLREMQKDVTRAQVRLEQELRFGNLQAVAELKSLASDALRKAQKINEHAAEAPEPAELAEPTERQAALARVMYFRKSKLPSLLDFGALRPVPVILLPEHRLQEARYNERFFQMEHDMNEIFHRLEGRHVTLDDVRIAAEHVHYERQRLLHGRQICTASFQQVLDMSSPEVAVLTCCCCLNRRTDTAKCCSCTSALCAECFGSSLQAARGKQWQGAAAVLRMDCFECHGHYDQQLLRLVPVDTLKLYAQGTAAVESTEQAMLRDRSSMKRSAELAGMGFIDRTVAEEKAKLLAHTAPKCPECHALFTDFDGCGALACPRCNQQFCALCLAASPSEQDNHRHVINCARQHLQKADFFFDAARYEEHERKRRRRAWTAEVEARSLPRTVKRQLLEACP